MTPAKKLLLLANMDAVWAEEVLRDRQADLSPQGVHDFTLLAFDDKDRAEEAMARRVVRDQHAENQRRKRP